MSRLIFMLALAVFAAIVSFPSEADSQLMCPRHNRTFEARTWTAADLQTLRGLRDAATSDGCDALARDVQDTITRLDSPSRPETPAEVPNPCRDAQRRLQSIRESTDIPTIEQYRARYERSCPTESLVAAMRLDQLTDPSGQLDQLDFNERDTRALDGRTDEQVDGLRYDQYSETLRAGEGISITVVSQEFPPIVVVGVGRLPDEFYGSISGEGDVGQEFTVNFLAPENGEYVFVVATREAAVLGAYDIELTRYVPPPPPTPRPVALGNTMSGELTDRARRPDSQGHFYEPWFLDARAGDRIQIDMNAGWDNYLILGTMVNGEFTEIARDDDGGGYPNARIRHTFEADGQYLIWATSWGQGRVGPYELAVRNLGPIPEARPIDMDRRPGAWHAAGLLMADLPTDAEGRPYIEYDFSPQRRGGIVIVAHGTQLTPIVDVSSVRRDEVTPLDTWTEESTRLRNRVELEAERNVTYRVRVTSPTVHAEGDFDLTIFPR